MDNSEIVSTPYIVDLAGGLGDVLNVFYLTEAINVLEKDKNTLVILRSHNKFAKDFVKQQGYNNIVDLSSAWPNATGEFFIEAKSKLESVCGIDFTSSEVLAIIERAYSPKINCPDPLSVKFFIDKKEKFILEYLKSKNNLVAIQCSAGSVDRNIPKEVIYNLVSLLLRKKYTPVILGNSSESGILFPDGVIDLQDAQTTVGFTIEVIKKCSYFIGSHSSMNLVAWHNKIKSLILMPESTYHSHFFDTLEEKTVWNFGAFDLNNKVALFSNYNDNLVKEFLR